MEVKKSLNLDKVILFILILSGCFQNIEILNITSGFGIKLYHIISIVLIIRLLKKTNFITRYKKN